MTEALDRYETTLEYDTHLLKQNDMTFLDPLGDDEKNTILSLLEPLSDNEKNCILFRRGEKEILRSLQSTS
jgi:hypothetical protein